MKQKAGLERVDTTSLATITKWIMEKPTDVANICVGECVGVIKASQLIMHICQCFYYCTLVFQKYCQEGEANFLLIICLVVRWEYSIWSLNCCTSQCVQWSDQPDTDSSFYRQNDVTTLWLWWRKSCLVIPRSLLLCCWLAWWCLCVLAS